MIHNNIVLLTSIGSFSSSYAIKSLQNNGYDVIGTGIYSGEYLPQTRLLKKYFKVPYYNSPSYFSTIKQIIEKCNVDIVVPLTDPEIDVLVNSKDTLYPAILGLSETKSLSLMRDKYECFRCLNNVLKNENVKTIPTYLLKEVNINALTYPCIVKPRNGRSSEGVEIYSSKKDLKEQIDNLKNEYLESRIIQPYIQGNIVTVDVVRDKYGCSYALPREELIRTRNGAGISVKIFRNISLENACRNIADILNVIGCVNFEFVKNDKKDIFYFLEANPRFSGGISFSGIAGYDMVKNHFQAIKGEPCEKMGEVKEHIFTKEYCEIDMSEILLSK